MSTRLRLGGGGEKRRGPTEECVVEIEPGRRCGHRWYTPRCRTTEGMRKRGEVLNINEKRCLKITRQHLKLKEKALDSIYTTVT